MKTKTALVLATAGVLLTGSAALAVNTLTLNTSPAGRTVPANGVLLPQNSTTAAPLVSDIPSPASPDSPAATPSTSDDTLHTEDARHSGTDDPGTVPSLAPAPAPARSLEPGDDHSGRGESEPGHKHSGKDD